MRRGHRRLGWCFLVCWALTLLVWPTAGAAQDQRAGEAVAKPSVPAWGPSLLAHVTRIQRRLNDTLARHMRLVRRGEAGAVATVLLVALGYGVVHAAGPGHGKAVVASLFLGREAHVARGIGVGFLISFLQIVSSIAVVAVLALVLRHSGLAVSQEAVWVEVMNYGLIVLVGLYLTAAAISGRAGHAHAGPGAVDGRRPPQAITNPAARGLILAAGLTPCPSGIIVLLFALANDVLPTGIGASLVMAVGMGVTVSAIGVAAIAARRGVLRPFRTRPRATQWAARSLAVAGSVTLTVVGSVLLVGAWTRLP